MRTRAPKPSRPFEWVMYVGGVVGFILLMLSTRRWDWVYPDPDVSWRGWQGLVGVVLSGVFVSWVLWNRVSPYSVDNQGDEDASVTLGLNRRDKDDESVN